MRVSIGDKFGRTTVIALQKNKHGQKCARVRCECGVEICRVLQDARRGHGCLRCTRSAFVRGIRATSLSRVAARYARLARVSIAEAAQAFGLNPGAVHNAWSRIYPTRPHPLRDKNKRPKCSACGQSGHLAVRGKCSPSAIALRLLQGGMSVRDASDQTGITTQAVYKAREWRRRSAA